MGQVTIYLDDDTEERMKAAAAAENLSRSQWIARAISDRIESEWPESVRHIAGAWEDFPSREEIHASLGEDVPREAF